MTEARHVLVVFHLVDCSPERLRDVVPRIQGALTKLSEGPFEQAFRSSNADLVAYGIKTKLAAGQIQAALESPGGRFDGTHPPLEGRDELLVLEIGADYSAGRKGFSRFLTWLQRH